jgi:hypothetical protein
MVPGVLEKIQEFPNPYGRGTPAKFEPKQQNAGCLLFSAHFIQRVGRFFEPIPWFAGGSVTALQSVHLNNNRIFSPLRLFRFGPLPLARLFHY